MSLVKHVWKLFMKLQNQLALYTRNGGDYAES